METRAHSPSRLALLLSLIVTCLSSSLLAADYYVAEDGSDRQAGTRSAPFRTISRAVNAAREPGDSIVLLEGTYRPTRTINLGNAGTEGNPITLRSAEGAQVVIDGSLCEENANLIAILTHHIRIEGLTIRNAKGIGIAPWGPGSRIHHIEILNNTVHHCYKGGIFAGAPSLEDPIRDLRIEGNTVHHTSMNNEDRSGKNGGWSFAIGAGFSSHVQLRNNIAYNNYGEAIALYLSDSGIISGNTAYDNFAVHFYLDNVTNTRVHRNLAYSTADPDFFRFGKPTNGIQIANERYRVSNPSARNRITHNILFGNGIGFCYGAYQKGGGLRETLFAHNTLVGSVGPLFSIDGDAGHSDTRIVNNIFVFSNARLPYVPEPRANLDFRNNLWFGTTPPPFLSGPGDIYEAPKLVDPDPDPRNPESFALRPNSPARNAAILLEGEDRSPHLGANWERLDR